MPTPFNLAELKVPPDSEYRALVERCPEAEPLRFSDGEYLIREGERGRDVFLVMRGSYVAERGESDEQGRPPATLGLDVCDLNAPSFVGEMAYFGEGCRSASVRSSGATLTLRLKPEHLDVIIAEFPLFTRVLCRKFTERLRESNDVLREGQRLYGMNASQVLLNPGDVLVAKGREADKLFQLVDGVLVRETGPDQETVTRDATVMGFVEPERYLLNQPYGATFRAKTPVIAVSVDRDSILAVVRNYPELILALYRKEQR